MTARICFRYGSGNLRWLGSDDVEQKWSSLFFEYLYLLADGTDGRGEVSEHHAG